MPELKLNRAASESLLKFTRVALPNHDIAGRIIPCFLDAGLPEPRVLWESIVTGSDDLKYLRWFVLMYQTFLPIMERFGVVDPGRRRSRHAAGSAYGRVDIIARPGRHPSLCQRLGDSSLISIQREPWRRFALASLPIMVHM